MRKCPKCGYKDPPCWKNAGYRTSGSYCKFSELEVFEPEIANQLRNTKGWVQIGQWFYKVSKYGNVNRVLPGYQKDEFSKHGFTEKSRIVDPKQRKLLGANSQ